MTDYRALITEMADELDHNRQCLLDDRRLTHPLADRARAALAKRQYIFPTPSQAAECGGPCYEGYYCPEACDCGVYKPPAPPAEGPTDADLEPALLEQRYFAPKEPTTEDKKPLSLVCNCHFKGMPPNPHQSWQDYFTHCAATGIISNLRIEAIQPTPSVNDTLLDAADD